MERVLALQIEDKAAIKKYIMNLKEEIGSQVRPLKPKTMSNMTEEISSEEIEINQTAEEEIITEEQTEYQLSLDDSSQYELDHSEQFEKEVF